MSADWSLDNARVSSMDDDTCELWYHESALDTLYELLIDELCPEMRKDGRIVKVPPGADYVPQKRIYETINRLFGCE